MNRPYCCDESRGLFKEYYGHQQKGGGEFPVYVGRYTQRGHGIGNLLGSLFRRILPVLKAAAPHVLRTGANIVEDVASGQLWKQAAIKRIPEAVRDVRLPERLKAAVLQGSGSSKRKRCKKDIFE